MRVTVFVAAAIGVLVCASAFAQSTALIGKIFEERRDDGSATVGIHGCVWGVQAEYEHGPGGPSTVRRVKLGFARVPSRAGRLGIDIDGVMHDLGPGEDMEFKGARGCRAYVPYLGVYVSRDMFLRIAKASSIICYADDRLLQVGDLDLELLSSLAKQLELPRRAPKRPSK
jgi:hypothetical protein